MPSKVYKVSANNRSGFEETYEESVIGYYDDKKKATSIAEHCYHIQPESYNNEVKEYEVVVEEISLDRTNPNMKSLSDGTLPGRDTEIEKYVARFGEDE